MLGAGGEQLAVYKGVQAAHEDSSGHAGRRVYMYNESYISLGGTLVSLPDGTKQYNAMDNIGSVRLTVSVNGDSLRLQSFDYKPFGDTLNAEDESRIGYASQERDEESRYFAMGARQYDPLAGRFLSVDPLYESFPDKTPYHYCNNNPISFKDPSGLSPEGEKGKENEVQICYGDEDKRMSEQMRQQIQDNFDESRNKKKQLAESVGKGEAMSDAARARMSEWSDGSGGGNGQGFDNTGWWERYGEDVAEVRTGDNESATDILESVESQFQDDVSIKGDKIITNSTECKDPWGELAIGVYSPFYILCFLASSKEMIDVSTSGTIDFVPVDQWGKERPEFKGKEVDAIGYTFIPYDKISNNEMKDLQKNYKNETILFAKKGDTYHVRVNKPLIKALNEQTNQYKGLNVSQVMGHELFHVYLNLKGFQTGHWSQFANNYFNAIDRVLGLDKFKR